MHRVWLTPTLYTQLNISPDFMLLPVLFVMLLLHGSIRPEFALRPLGQLSACHGAVCLSTWMGLEL